MNMFICSICDREIVGFSHNAEPINSGRCCSACNNKVVARRMEEVQEEMKYGSIIRSLKNLKSINNDSYNQIIKGMILSIKKSETYDKTSSDWDGIKLYKRVLETLEESYE